MTHKEAKEILVAYRHDLPPDEAPALAEALGLMEQDPTLGAWFEAEQRFDDEFARALDSIAVPEDLLGKIVEERETSLETGLEEDQVVVFPRRRLWFGAAAAAVILSALGLVKYFMFPPPVVFPDGNFASVKKFCDDMAYYANSRFVLGKTTDDYLAVRGWLQNRESPVYDAPPSTIVRYKGMGCQTFFWGENKVSLVCFKKPEDEIVHLFVVEREIFEDLVSPEEFRAIQVRHELETGGWMAEDKLYLLVGSEPGVAIGDVLAES